MLDLNDEETLRFGYVHEQKGCEQSSTLWRERKAISTRCQNACNCESMQDRFMSSIDLHGAYSYSGLATITPLRVNLLCAWHAVESILVKHPVGSTVITDLT